MNISLQGRTALVTGGTRGIGQAISLTLAEAGSDVALYYNRDHRAAHKVTEVISALGRRVKAYVASIDNQQDDEALVSQVVANFGGLDILVNNAGIASRGQAVHDQDFWEMHRVFGLNAFAPYYLSKAALPHLRRAKRGDIIMISSMAAKLLPLNSAPYNMSKTTLEALAKTIAKEEARNDIHCNIVSPGLTVTDMGRKVAKARLGAADIRDLDAGSPFGHVCTPQEAAAIVVFLVSDANGYANGQNIIVDGGVEQPT